MDTTLHFNTIQLIEWLRRDDLRTGLRLFRELEPIGIAARPPVSVKYWRISTRAEFIARLQSVATDVRQNGHLPILHIETHGDSDGIGVSDREGLLWRDLMSELIPINEIMRLNLFVILAACEGFWGVHMIQPIERAACRALIGPMHEITAGKIMNASVKFFRTMFEEKSGPRAFQAMNDAIDPRQRTFEVITAETAFRRIFQIYLKDHCTEEKLIARENSIVAQKEPIERACDRSDEELNQARLKLRALLRDHRLHFEEMRRNFFFVDLYPENDARFDIKFEDCVRGATDPEGNWRNQGN